MLVASSTGTVLRAPHPQSSVLDPSTTLEESCHESPILQDTSHVHPHCAGPEESKLHQIGFICYFSSQGGVASLGSQLDKPGKTKPHLRNCLHHIGLWLCIRDVFFIAN